MRGVRPCGEMYLQDTLNAIKRVLFHLY
jgi:hypothetical protein